MRARSFFSRRHSWRREGRPSSEMKLRLDDAALEGYLGCSADYRPAGREWLAGA